MKIKKKKVALITGISGQDGSYLTEFLLEKGYVVHGIIRRSSVINSHRIAHLMKDRTIYNKSLFLSYGDVTDAISIKNLLYQIKPDEIYNLAAQSHVKISFEIPEITAHSDSIAVLKILETIRNLKLKTKLYQASTSELFGKVIETPQKETTPFYPRSPYGVAKLYAYWIIKNYREAYNLFAVNGLLFNHESERRSFNFVTRKITLGLASIKLGYQKKLEMGNLAARRDWGYAPDYVEAMWLMMQQKKPKDYLVATGETHSVKEFIEVAGRALGFDFIWKGKGLSEKGIDRTTKRPLVVVNKKYFRPTEVDLLLGDYSKIKRELGWKPKTTFHALAERMAKSDYELLKQTKGSFTF